MKSNIYTGSREQRKVTTISRKTLIKWKRAADSGVVFYNIKVGKPGTELKTKRVMRGDRICYFWGLAKKGPFVDAFANEEWIYFRIGLKEYRTPLH